MGNPFEVISELNDKVDTLNHNWESFKYWVNPVNWFVEANRGLYTIINHEDTATVLMAGTIIGIWLIMADVKWVKKWLFWSWVIYWVLRGFVYPNHVVPVG